ncbi:hypothetical protein X781_3790 [Mannheimia sp. USDA-ARS-USMARC-1261]|uniref:hypothetical protein n=1 Tax=Mannheimia sp. USDA-ARS-USMARC-1261 TaxID=1432056 RepID=UPI0003E37BC3|nr:hypothetical protein [Mannheimia sp. USDA-ARS-USMARC-1261]AHG72528.1 hypothetical protein X781_3790 [Mannheimia sp. USDA-ARS-USMARC-1261]
MKRLVEITQDAACVLDIEDDVGFFTENIESCVVYIIRTDSSWIAIHDSGQLNINNLSQFILEYGKVKELKVLYGNQRIDSFHRRHNKLLRKLKYKNRVDEKKIISDQFNIYFTFNGNKSLLSYQNSEEFFLEHLPERDKRHAIIKLNNAFIKLRSESLNVDVQYSNREFQFNTELLFSNDYILQRAEQELEHLIINISIINEALRENVINFSAIEQSRFNQLVRLV